MNPLMENARLLLVLRDAIQSAKEWEDVEEGLRARGVSLQDIRERIRPRIGFDPHSHTVHSDGMFTYQQLIWWCRATGLHAIGITDHDNIHVSIGDAVEEGLKESIHIIPGLEFTVHRLGGQFWKGLEVGLHFFPAIDFADFIRSEKGAAFRQRYEHSAKIKSEQGWGAMEATNQALLKPNGLPLIEREEMWEASGKADPVCPATVTLLVLKRIQESGNEALQSAFPNTRVIYTHMQVNALVPPSTLQPQTFDDLGRLRRELREADIRSTLTMNHPEEWLSKCGLVLADGSPDLPAIRRLVLLMMLNDPVGNPVQFMELWTGRSTPATLDLFEGLYRELKAFRKNYLPQLSDFWALASTDSHRITGSLDEQGQPRGWVPGEDFVFGLGALDTSSPYGNLDVPEDYPGWEDILDQMERAAV